MELFWPGHTDSCINSNSWLMDCRTTGPLFLREKDRVCVCVCLCVYQAVRNRISARHKCQTGRSSVTEGRVCVFMYVVCAGLISLDVGQRGCSSVARDSSTILPKTGEKHPFLTHLNGVKGVTHTVDYCTTLKPRGSVSSG